MSPPQLTGYAPIPYVFHPVEINFFKARGHKIDLAVPHALYRPLCKRFHFYKPLLAHDRLNRSFAAVALPDVVGIILYFDKLPQLVHFGNHLFARFLAGKPLKHTARFFVHRAVVVHDAQDFKIVP